FRIEVRARRLSGGSTGQKSLVLVDLRPRALVDPEIMQPRLAQRRFVLLELLVERQIAAPELLHEDVVHNACSLDQLDQRFSVSFGKACSVHLEWCRRKAGSHAPQFVKTRSLGRGGGFLGNARGHKNQDSKKD